MRGNGGFVTAERTRADDAGEGWIGNIEVWCLCVCSGCACSATSELCWGILFEGIGYATFCIGCRKRCDTCDVK